MIYCPNCGKSHYISHYSMATAMYYPPVYKDGVNTNPDGNTTTTYCTCCECNHNFSYSIRFGEIESITDHGEAEKIPVVETPITVPSGAENTTVRAEDVLVKSSWNDKNTVTIPMNKDLDEIRHEIVELREELSALKDVIIDVFSQKM